MNEPMPLSLALTMPQLTFEQAAALEKGDSVYSRNLFNSEGKPYRYRVTSSPRRWKRSPGRITVKVMYGLKVGGEINEHVFDSFSLSDGTVPDGDTEVRLGKNSVSMWLLRESYLNSLAKGCPRKKAIEEAWHISKEDIKEAVKAGRLVLVGGAL